MPTPPSRRRIALYTVLGVLGFVAILLLLVRRRGTLLEAGFRDWLIGEVSSATDSVYTLSVGNLRLSLLPGRISIDSLRLVTDTARNDFRADPYPVLTATASSCRITGIDTWRLLTAQGVTARRFRCETINAHVLEVVRPHVPVKSATETPKSGVPLVNDSIHLPALLPLIVVHGTELPSIALDYTRRARDSAETHITLQRVSLVLRETRIDPAVPPKARRPLFSEQALVSAAELEIGSGQQSVLLGKMRANLTDSTLSIDSVVIGPKQSDAQWVKLQKERRDLIRMRLDSARFRGVDYRRLSSVEGAIVADRIDMFDFRVHVTTDKDLPAGVKKRRRTPQQFMAALDRPLAIDTVIVTGGRIAYTEHVQGKPAAGTMTWEKVRAEITDVISTAPAAGKAPPMVIKASALLLGQGKFETTIEIPLTAPQFDMKYSGSLGPMDLGAVNAFSVPVLAAKVTSGSLQSVRFSVVVRNGRSVGQVTPLYRDFKLQLTDKKANFLKKAGMAIVSLFANTFKVRGNNPDKPGEAPVVGRINHLYSATASLPQLFWFALREGLGKVFVK